MSTLAVSMFYRSVFAFLSVIACICVCINIILIGYKPCYNIINGFKKSKSGIDRFIVMEVIFWMCITDGLHLLQMLLIWIPQIFVDPHIWFYDGYNGIMCFIISIIGTFICIQSPIWHIILVYDFLYILKSHSISKLTLLNNQKKYQFIIAIIVLIYIVY